MYTMSQKRKRQLTYTVIGLMFLLGGIEYAVILPTMWLYIENRFNAEEYFLGLMLSAFCFSGLFSGPLFGRWSDATRKSRFILLFGNCWEIAGNIMYFLGVSKWFLFSSRLVAGVGSGVEATLLAEITRNTPVDKRTGVLSIFIAIRQLGLLIGPGFNLFLRELHFYIGPFLVDKFSSPGLFMAVLWSVLQIVIVFCYWELDGLYENNDRDTNHVVTNSSEYEKIPDNVSRPGPIPPSNQIRDRYQSLGNSLPSSASANYDEEFMENDMSASYPKLVVTKTSRLAEQESFHNSSDLIESAERYMSVDSNTVSTGYQNGSVRRERTLPSTYGSINNQEQSLSSISGLNNHDINDNSKIITKNKNGHSWHYYYDEYMREPVIVLLAVLFISFFNQVALETMITPLTAKYLNWGELENSLMYCGAGLQIILVFLFIRWLSKRLLDRTMLLIGCVLLVIANGWLIWVVPNAKTGQIKANTVKFMIGVVLDLLALPFLVVCGVSMFSKITRKETQGMSQGVRRTVCGIGTIIGPLWAGSALPWPYIMLGVMFGLVTMSFIMLLLSFKTLKMTQEVDENEAPPKISSEETQPLMA